MAPIVADGFTLDPPGYERLNMWTHVLTNLLHAKQNFEWVSQDSRENRDVASIIREQAFFIAGVMAYGRCYAQSGPGVPTLDAKQVYKGSADGMEVHERLIAIRNTVAAHTDTSDLVRLTLAVRDEPEQIVIRHLSTSALSLPEVIDFIEAVDHTSHFVTITVNRYLDRLGLELGKKIVLD